MYIGGTGVASHVQGYEFKPLHYKIKKHNTTVHNFPKKMRECFKTTQQNNYNHRSKHREP